MAVADRDLYETLGVARDASEEEIRAAYRKLARENHPDVNKDPGAEDRFKEVSEAYEILRDSEKRERYDRRGSGPQGFEGYEGYGGFGGGGGGADVDDLFESLFGGRGRGRGGFGGFEGFRARGRDIEAVLELPLEEAARGGTRHLSIDGRDYDVQIPAGVRDGQLIRLAGEGQPGMGGGPAGDLLLRIRLRPHPRFRVDDSDLITDLPVTPWEAALGAEVRLATLTGNARVRVPPGSSSGRRLRLRGEGLGPGGDLYATVMIHVPKTLTDEERELFERLRETSRFDPRNGS